jgi:branched-chain amino acid aminotransferase
MSIAINEQTRIWLNGELQDPDAARLSHLTHTFHYGLGAFEGIRSYQVADRQGAVFRLGAHIKRLLASCHLVTIGSAVEYSQAELEAACVETLRANNLAGGYIRPVVYVAAGAMGVGAMENPIHTMIAAWKWGAYLGEEGLTQGIDAMISSYSRPGHAGVMSKGKLCGQYINSILAKREALAGGFAEAILLNEQGYVTEASGENLFIVVDGEIVTPPLGMNILAGITRATVIEVARAMGYTVTERAFARDELYLSDEIFMTGTAAEVTPVRSVDRRAIGAGGRGPVTEALQTAYFDIVQGRNSSYDHWLTRYDV